MPDTDDLYEILQVLPTAHPDVIQAAYRRLAMLYHPDRNPSAEAAEMLKQLNLAYEILGDPDRRAEYDRERVAQQRQGTGTGSRYSHGRPIRVVGGVPGLAAVGLLAMVVSVSCIGGQGGGDDGGAGEVAVLPTATPTVAPSPTVGATETPVPTLTPRPTPVPSPTPTAIRTPGPTPQPTLVPSPAPPPTLMPSPTAMPTAVSVVTATPGPTVTPAPSLAVDLDGSTEAVIGGHTFTLELATTVEERRIGLSNRDHLASNAGMLFVFKEESILSFWMKDTLIPLDILFLDQDRRIVDIRTMTPQPGVPTNQLTVYRSALPAMYAVELNAGTAAELGLAPGMVVDFMVPS